MHLTKTLFSSHSKKQTAQKPNTEVTESKELREFIVKSLCLWRNYYFSMLKITIPLKPTENSIHIQYITKLLDLTTQSLRSAFQIFCWNTKLCNEGTQYKYLHINLKNKHSWRWRNEDLWVFVNICREQFFFKLSLLLNWSSLILWDFCFLFLKSRGCTHYCFPTTPNSSGNADTVMNRQKYSRKIEVRAKFYEIALMNTEKLLKRLAHPIRKRILPWQDRSSKFIKFSIHSFCNFASFLLHFQFQVFQHLFHSAWNKHIFVHYSRYFFPVLNSEQNRIN